MSIYRAIITFNHASAGDLDRARGVFGQLAAGGFEFPYDNTWLIASSFAAETAFILTDTAAAALLSDRIEPYRDLIVASGVVSIGAASHYLGLLAATLGQDDKAEHYLSDALARHERLEAPFLKARTLLELARLVSAREPESARAFVDQAIDLAERYGMTRVRERAIDAQHQNAPPA